MNSDGKIGICNEFAPTITSDLQGKITRKLKRIKVLDGVALLVPALQFLEIRAVGRLFLPEVFLACMLPLLLLDRGRRLKARLPAYFIFFALLWLFGQIITDIVRETVFKDYVRGWAKIGSTVISFCALYLLLYGRRHRLVVFAIGLTIGGLLRYFLNPGIFAEGSPWKFGYGEPLTWSLILLAASTLDKGRMGFLAATAIVILAGCLNVFEGFRSLGAICLLTAGFALLQILLAHFSPRAQKPLSRAFLIGLMLGIVSVTVFTVYSNFARSGLLGEHAQATYVSQASGKYGLLLGGRSEVLVSSRAILDSPFLGHGSWAKDYEYTEMLTELRREAGYSMGLEDEEGQIPTHSHLAGAWVEAGLLGAIFWAWVLTLPMRALSLPLQKMDYFVLIAAFVALILGWDILFSPFGAERRFLTPFYIVLIMTFLGENRSVVSEGVS